MSFGCPTHREDLVSQVVVQGTGYEYDKHRAGCSDEGLRPTESLVCVSWVWLGTFRMLWPQQYTHPLALNSEGNFFIEKGWLLCTHLPSGNHPEPSLPLIYPVIDDVCLDVSQQWRESGGQGWPGGCREACVWSSAVAGKEGHSAG